MANELQINGRASVIINPNINVDIGLYLSAIYKGREYDLKTVKAVSGDDGVHVAVMVFNPHDGVEIPAKSNYIVLATTFGGTYRATGICRMHGGGRPEFSQLGDDLSIIVEESAQQAIETIRSSKPELQIQMVGVDMPTELFDAFGIEC